MHGFFVGPQEQLALATHAEQMRDALKTALLKGTIVESVAVDGVTTRFRDRKELRDEYQFWCREVAREQGTRPPIAQIDLSGAFDA